MFAIVFGRFVWGGAGWVDIRTGADVLAFDSEGDALREANEYAGLIGSTDFRVVRLA